MHYTLPTKLFNIELTDEDKLLILTYSMKEKYINIFKENKYKIVKENYGIENSFIIIPFTMNSLEFKLSIKNDNLVDKIESILKFII
jgi:hypothetical protein